MKLWLWALAAGVCFAQSPMQLQTNGLLAGGPVAANAGTGQPFAAGTVTGQPFIAEAVVEIDQTLPDGSHIVNRQNVSAARDSQGRTYREEILAAPSIGSSALKTMYISDPVAHANYFLSPDHVAHKMPMPQPGTATVSTSSAAAGLYLQRFRTAAGGGNGPVQAGTQTAQPAQQPTPGNLKTEKLGTQTIVGFASEGTRTTLTIPAGQIGNQNPLEIITERWYSQDLAATVLVKHSDPRVGTSSYQLTTVQQIEPPASLFQIPAGYTVEEVSR
jgi:hypothetical protein